MVHSFLREKSIYLNEFYDRLIFPVAEIVDFTVPNHILSVNVAACSIRSIDLATIIINTITIEKL